MLKSVFVCYAFLSGCQRDSVPEEWKRFREAAVKEASTRGLSLSSDQLAALTEVCKLDRIPFDKWTPESNRLEGELPTRSMERLERLPISEKDRVNVIENSLKRGRLFDSAASDDIPAAELVMIYLRLAGRYCLHNSTD